MTSYNFTNKIFKNKTAVKKYTSEYLKNNNTFKQPEDALLFVEILSRHPEFDYFEGYDELIISKNRNNQNAFYFLYPDKSLKDISFHKALDGLPSVKQIALKTMRCEISGQISTFFLEYFSPVNWGKGSVPQCGICGIEVAKQNDLHVDHIIYFRDLVTMYMETNHPTGDFEQLTGPNLGEGVYRMTDTDEAAKWRDFHRKNATLRCVCARCNLTRTS